MKMHILAIRDIVADCYLMPPMFVHNIGAAVRDFGDECQRQAPDNRLSKHPEHYELWHVGDVDDQNCQFDCKTEDNNQLAVGANYRV